MKKLFLLFLVIPFLWVSCPAGDSGDPPGGDTSVPITGIGDKDGLSGLTAAKYFEEKGVYIGWNLGNAFDALNPGNGSGGYGAWTPKISAGFFPKIKEAGFNVVRVPVSWDITASKPIGAAPDYKLNQSTLNELTQVVDWAYQAGLVTIINIHHDDKTWLDLKKLKVAANRPEITAKFVRVWEQIAEKFKDYGDWLIFESFNELHNGGWGWGNIDAIEFEIINDLNQQFTNTVRAAGGKNAERFLVIQPLCGKPHQAVASTFILPADTIAGKQIVSMHYYEPEGFCLNGTTVDWNNKNEITTQFRSYANKFTKNNIPVILGECGATFQKRDGAADRATAHENRIKYMEWMCGQAKENKIVPIYWDNGTITGNGIGENFGLFNRNTGNPLVDSTGLKMQDIIDVMINTEK